MTKFKDIAHLYIGCMVQYPDTCGKEITARLTGVTISEIETTYKRKRKGCVGDILTWRPTASHNSDALHTKPILRPLSSMTEDEENEISNLYFQFMETQIKGTRDCRMMAAVTKWYLDKHFDIFGLIEAGEAIEKEVQKA